MPKELAQEASKRFDLALDNIINSDLPEFSRIALQTVEQILDEKIYTAENDEYFQGTTAISHRLALKTVTPALEHAQVYVLDIGKILSVSNEELQADLVRSIAIADQYPLNGYQDRHITIYFKALDVQTRWLQYRKTPRVRLDPRFEKHEEIIKELLPERHYYCDVGFNDWVAAAYAEEKFVSSAVERHNLHKLRDDSGFFINTREYRVPSIYNYFLQTEELAFKEDYSSDQRAEIVAGLLLRSSLMSKGLFTDRP